MRLSCGARLVCSLLATVVLARCGRGPAARELRVCADPNNLPFSNERGEGFENRLAEIVAGELGAVVRYTWWAQRRGFIRNTLGAGSCDVVMGVPVDLERVRATRPYYRSAYAFVYRRGGMEALRSLDDPRLRTLRVGVHIIGDDYANAPPAHALAARNIVRNVVGYSIFGDYTQPNPPARLIEAVAAGEVDVAIAWGPLAGYFARRQRVALEVVPVEPDTRRSAPPLSYAIAMGVRPADRPLQEELDGVLERRAADITALLVEYGVPVAR